MLQLEKLKEEAVRIRNVAIAQLDGSVPYGMAPDIVDAIVATVHAQIALAAWQIGEGWLKWECTKRHPVKESDLVEVIYRDGDTEISTGLGCDDYWVHAGLPSDIIAYRIVKSA